MARVRSPQPARRRLRNAERHRLLDADDVHRRRVVLRGSAGELPMIAVESAGKRGRGVALRLPAGANASDQDALVASVACPGSKGKNKCVAVGYYDDAAGMQAFIAEGAGTRWGRASKVTLPPGASAGGTGALSGLRCRVAGACVAVGAYFTKSGASEALAVFYEGGRWRRPAGVTALPANASASDPGASLDGVSCGALTCLAVGDYKDRQGAQEVMAVSEAGGRWEGAHVRTARARGPGERAAGVPVRRDVRA
jgi:hypothetical protein